MSPRAAKAASVGGFLLAVAGLAGLIYRRSVFATLPVGLVVQLLAFALMAWARFTFRMRSFHFAANPTEGGLVTTGPYRYWRHPIYAAVLYFTLAAVLTHLNAWSVAMGVLIALGLGIRMVLEERLVRQMYPEYEEYARRTKRIVPFLF